MARIQVSTGSGGVQSTHSLVFGSAVSSGNSLFACYSYRTGLGISSKAEMTVSDNVNAGNWSSLVEMDLTNGLGEGVSIVYKLNISSGAAASTYRVSFDSPSTHTM